MVSDWASGLRASCTRAVVAGATGGAAAGVIDALWSWGSMSQFVALAGKLRALAYLGATYALAGALAAPLALVLALLLVRTTRLGDLGRAASAVGGTGAGRVSLAISLAITSVAALGVTFLVLSPQLASRKHTGLVIAVSMVAAVLAIAVAIVIGFVLSRLLELALHRAGKTATKLLEARGAPLLVASIALAIGVAIISWRAWETLALLRLRPALVALLACLLVIAARPIAAAAVGALEPLRAALRRSAIASVYVVSTALALSLGASSPSRKAATRYSGLGGPLTVALRSVFDFDRDGHSRALGGGDCNDWDSSIHPGAPDLPDDGIDGNCVGGDVTLEGGPIDVSFAELPAALPADFNVVLITIDTLRADHLGAYGYKRETSPALDALAADGALFENGWAHAPSTRYSIPSILTGRLPLAVDDFPIPGGWPGVAESNTTIAEVMKHSGMFTAAILNYWYFEERRRMNQGFDSYDNQNRRLHKAVGSRGPAETTGTSSAEQTSAAIKFLDERGTERFFLWVHYYDPHYAYEAHPGTKSFGDGDVARYDGEIRFTDDHIARLVADLRRRGLYEKTVIVVTGDHGEGFGEHGVKQHGYNLYAAQTKVPLIIRVPGARPTRVATPAGHVDILPTLANLTGAKPETMASMTTGRSLLGLITGADADGDRTIFQQLSFEDNNEMRAAVSKRCHVIFNVSPHRSWEVYDLENDPGESRDRSGGDHCRDVVAELERFHDRSEIPVDAATALLDGRPMIEEPLDVAFPSAAKLLEVRLPPRSVRRGDRVPIGFTFEALGAIEQQWRVFVHLQGNGKAFMQADHDPARPFPWWRSGQYIRYQRPLFVPSNASAGEYRVYVGLFRGKERHPVEVGGRAPEDRRALVGVLRVEP